MDEKISSAPHFTLETSPFQQIFALLSKETRTKSGKGDQAEETKERDETEDQEKDERRMESREMDEKKYQEMNSFALSLRVEHLWLLLDAFGERTVRGALQILASFF